MGTPHPMALPREGTTLLLVDVQERLFPAMDADHREADVPAPRPGRHRGLPRARPSHPLMPRYFDIGSTVLLVVGYGILPEEEDRPIAYELKRAIGSRNDGDENRSGVVVSDMWMVNQEMAELFTAIAAAGPAGH